MSGRGSVSINEEFYRPLFRQLVRGLHQTVSLVADNYVISREQPPVLWIDPNGASRDVLLPTEADSIHQILVIINTADAAENLVVKEDSDTTTIVTVNQNEIGVFFCNGIAWRGFSGAL